MASAVIVLKRKTSTLRQCHNFNSIDSTFSVGNNVTEVNCPAECGSGPMSGRDATWGQHIRVLWLFWVLFFWFFLLFNRATTHTREPMFAHNAQKTRSGVSKIHLGMRNVSLILKFGGVYPNNTLKIGRNGQLAAKIKCRKTLKRKEMREMCQCTMIMKLGSLFQILSTKPVWNAP